MKTKNTRGFCGTTAQKGLRSTVENVDNRKKAVGLLEGFKVILPMTDDRLCWFVLTLFLHTKVLQQTVDHQTQCRANTGWNTYIQSYLSDSVVQFMEICSVSTSGNTSKSMQIFFLLSAKIEIMQTQDNEDFKVEIRASTLAAFDLAKTGLAKVSKFYRGIVLWEKEKREINLDEITNMIEPAQVLVMTASTRVQKRADIIAIFNKTITAVDFSLKIVKHFIQEAGTSFEKQEGKNLV